MTSPLELRFIHHAPKTESDDEIVRISPFVDRNGKTIYMWRYLYPGHPTRLMYLESEFHVNEQLRSMAKMLEMDLDPYKNVQLFFPTMPSVMFTPQDFVDSVDTIIHSIGTALRNWPSQLSNEEAAKVAVAGVKRLLSARDEEDEDDEMPPLAPIESEVDYSYFGIGGEASKKKAAVRDIWNVPASRKVEWKDSYYGDKWEH